MFLKKTGHTSNYLPSSEIFNKVILSTEINNYSQTSPLVAAPDFAKCPQCGVTECEELPGKGPHTTAIVCRECERFLRWGKSHAAIAREKATKKKIIWLLERPQVLTQWERHFITSIQQQRKLSPKQSECLERIFNRCSSALASELAGQEVL